MRFENRDGFAELGENGSGFEPDISAADHCHCCDFCQLSHQLVDVGARADGVNAWEIVTQARDAPGVTARCPNQG